LRPIPYLPILQKAPKMSNRIGFWGMYVPEHTSEAIEIQDASKLI